MPKVCERKEVLRIAAYLQKRPNEWISRLKLLTMVGLSAKHAPSIMAGLNENFPNITFEDREDGRGEVVMMWVTE